jgi:hypothetical protein
MKLNKRSRWIIVATVLAVLPVLLLTQVDAVRAMFDGVHALNVYLRIETEILQKTPAGQYYDSLFWKHVDEVNQIISAHPEHEEELLRATLMFVPELEALLDGNGDKVYITFEHVKSLKSELDWFASKSSPALQDAIQRESQRLPLDDFVGMTMSEAWDFINSRWTPDMVIDQTLVTSSVVQPTLVPEPELSRVTYFPEAQTLVPDSDGKWAYYVCKGIYLEYPATHYFDISESDDGCFIQFMPFTSEPLQWNPRSIMVYVSEVPATRKDLLNPSAFYPAGSVPWEVVIRNGEFEGVEYIVNSSNEPGMDIHALQYNQKNQLIVGIQIQINEDLQISDHSDYFALINQRYEDFQHMVNSLQIQTP